MTYEPKCFVLFEGTSKADALAKYDTWGNDLNDAMGLPWNYIDGMGNQVVGATSYTSAIEHPDPNTFLVAAYLNGCKPGYKDSTAQTNYDFTRKTRAEIEALGFFSQE